MQFIKCEIFIFYKGEKFSNKELGQTNFLKGGAAREAAFQYLTHGQVGMVAPRDLDFWVINPTPLVEKWIEAGEDWRCLSKWGMESIGVEEWPKNILSWRAIDVNINSCLISHDGLWIGWELIEGWLRREIWRVDNYLPKKRAIRAHFFGVRYGFKVLGSQLPKKCSYYKAAAHKATALGISSQWEEYLSVREIDWRPYLFSGEGGTKIMPNQEDLKLLEEHLLEEGLYYYRGSDYIFYNCYSDGGGMVTGLVNRYTGEYFISPIYIYGIYGTSGEGSAIEEKEIEVEVEVVHQ